MPFLRVLGVIALTLVLVVVAMGAGAWVYLKGHTFSARVRPPAIEITMADFVRDVSTPKYTKDLKDPLPVTPESVAEGRNLYMHDCAMCHANDGSGKSEIGGGLYPPIPALREKDSQSTSDGQLYYVIRNGIPFSGMPAFNASDDATWKLVQFIRHLPQISQGEMEEMRAMNGLPR